MRRDKAEAKITAEEDNLMVLIYPLVPHRIEFFIKSNFEFEERAFKKHIEETKKAKLDEVGGDKKKLDFDLQRDIYEKDVKNFMFELDIKRRNQKGELIIPNDKSPEEIAEIEFKNQVYERLFKRIEAKESLRDNSEDDDSDDGKKGMKKSLREDWVNQKIYELCERETEFLWDNFTSGNAGEKHAKLKKD